MSCAAVVQTQSHLASPILGEPVLNRELAGICVSVLYKAPGWSIQVLWSDSCQILVIMMGWSSDLQLSPFQWKSQHWGFTGLCKTLSSPSKDPPGLQAAADSPVPSKTVPILSLRCFWACECVRGRRCITQSTASALTCPASGIKEQHSIASVESSLPGRADWSSEVLAQPAPSWLCSWKSCSIIHKVCTDSTKSQRGFC